MESLRRWARWTGSSNISTTSWSSSLSRRLAARCWWTWSASQAATGQWDKDLLPSGVSRFLVTTLFSSMHHLGSGARCVVVVFAMVVKTWLRAWDKFDIWSRTCQGWHDHEAVWVQAVTCVTLQPMMLQVNIHLILHQIIPLQVILHQINLMRFDVWYKGLQLTLDIFGQNRLRSKGWLKQDEDQGALCVEEDCRRHHHLQGAGDPRASAARSCHLGGMHKHPGEGAWEEIEAQPRDQLHQGQFLRDLPQGVQITHLHISQMYQGPMTDPEGPMTDPDQRCHNDLESLPMIAMSLSDWSETIWHQMDRSTTRTCQWQHWTVSSLAKLCLFASVRVTGIGSFGFAKMAKIHWWKEFEWTSWFEIISGPIGLSRSRMASITGSDLRGADLAMEATGNSLKTTLTAKQWYVWTTRGSMWLCFTTHLGCSMTPGGEHTWAFVSSWPPTRNCGI